MKQKDLTKGPVFQTMFVYALPMICGNILQQGYNIADTWVVGNFIGTGALGAVGSAFALMTFLTSVLLGLCMGSGVVFSRCFGRKDAQGLKCSICASFVLTAAVSFVLTAGSLLLTDYIITWMNIPDAVRDITKDYLELIFWGIPAVALYNFFAAYLKSIGNSVVPLVFLGISTVLNISLDILFVVCLNRGTSGAAAATVIAQYISGIGIGFYVLMKRQEAAAAFLHFRISKSSLGEIAGYSVLTCMQQSVMNLGILMVQGLVNSFGTDIMAAFAAAVKIEAFTYMPAQEYANAFSTFTAQNAGAGSRKRIREGIRCAFMTSAAYCLAASAVIWIFAERLMRLFVRADETAIIKEGVRYLHIVGPFYCGIGCLFLFYALYRAAGRPGMSVVLTAVSLGTRVGLSYMLAAVWTAGVCGIWWSIPIGWGLADLTGAVYYKKSGLAGEKGQL